MRIKSKIDLNLLRKGLHHLNVERLRDLDGSYKNTESLAGRLCEQIGIGRSAVNRRKVILVSRKLLGNVFKPIQDGDQPMRDRRKRQRPRRFNSDEYILPLQKKRQRVNLNRLRFLSPFQRTSKIRQNDSIQYDREYIQSNMDCTFDTQTVMARKVNLEDSLYAADSDYCKVSHTTDDVSQSFLEDNAKDGFRHYTSDDIQMDTFTSDGYISTNYERQRLDRTSSAELVQAEKIGKDDIKSYHGVCNNSQTKSIAHEETTLTEKMKCEDYAADDCKLSSNGDEMLRSNAFVVQRFAQDRETCKVEDDVRLLNDISDNTSVENFDVSCSQDIIEESKYLSESANVEDDMSSSDGNKHKPYREIESPESFEVCLSKDEWIQIKPSKYESQRKLRGNWTDILTQKVSEKVPSCVLRFTYNRVKRKGTRKKNARYFYGKANCQFENCAQFIFEIQKKPKHVSRNGVQIKVTRKGEVRHKKFEERRRQLRGKKREEYKQEIERSDASKLHYDILGTMDRTAFDAGNRTDASTKQVLRNLQYERNKEYNLDDDDWKDLVLTKHVLEDCDKESSHVRGYVQFLSISPFTVILFTEKQLQLLRNKVKTDESVLYLDATGSVVRKLKDSNKEIFYYAAVLKGNKSKEPPIPIAEMITNEHTATMISLLLARVKQALLTLYRTWTVVQPTRIELDYSWAMINAVLLICNQENITRYLTRTWEMARKSTSPAKFTKVHLCSAHLIKRVRDRLSKVTTDKGLAEYCTFSFALLQNSYTLMQASDLYSSICIVLGSEFVTNAVGESIEKIQRRIALLPHADEVSSIHAPELETNVETETGATIKASSPFHKYFEDIRSQSIEMAKRCTETTCRRNPYHNVKALDVIESYLHIYPLWSGLLLKQETSSQDRTRDTNCFVEYWFRIVKYDILKKKLRQRAGRFVRMLHLNIIGRCREYEYSMKSTIRQRRVKDIEIETAQVKQDDIDVSKEQWRREAKTSQTTPRYFSPPKKIPTPKKRNAKDVRKAMLPSDVMEQGENMIKKTGITTFYPALSETKESFLQSSLIVRSDKADPPGHGLENKYNNCWLNSLLQAMKNCDGLLQTPASTMTTINRGIADPILDILQEKMRLLLTETDEKVVHSVDDILDVIQAVPQYREIEVGEQQDPSVLLQDLLVRLHDVKSFEPSTLHYEHQCIICGENRKVSEEKAYMFMVEMSLYEPTVQKCLD